MLSDINYIFPIATGKRRNFLKHSISFLYQIFIESLLCGTILGSVLGSKDIIMSERKSLLSSVWFLSGESASI